MLALRLFAFSLLLIACQAFTLNRSVIPMLWSVPLNSLQNSSRETSKYVASEKVGRHTENGLIMKRTIENAEDVLLENFASDSTTEYSENSGKNGGGGCGSGGGNIRNTKNGDVASLRNVVVLLIDVPEEDEEEGFWRSFQKNYSFPVETSLQVCPPPESIPRITIDGFPLSSREDCNCNEYLRKSVVSLLTWAHNVKMMSTAAFSASNFSIPPVVDADRSIEVDVYGESSDKKDTKLIEKRESDNKTKFFEQQSSSTAPYDGPWEVLDVFSKIRAAFFRAILDSLGAVDDDELLQRSNVVEPKPLQRFKRDNLLNSLSNAIRDLRMVSRGKEYMLAVAAPASELFAAVDLIHRETTKSETLLVVVGTCNKNTDPLPLFAEGPDAEIFRKARNIWDLPNIVEGVNQCDCHHHGRRQRPEKFFNLVRAASDHRHLRHDNKSTSERDKLQSRMTTDSGASALRITMPSDSVTLFLGIMTSFVATKVLQCS